MLASLFIIMSLFQLLDTCMKNCDGRFRALVARKKFQEELVKCARKTVRTCIKVIILVCVCLLFIFPFSWLVISFRIQLHC